MTTAPIRPAPVVYADLGTIWIQRGDLAVYVEPDEVAAVVSAMLATADQLGDAR